MFCNYSFSSDMMIVDETMESSSTALLSSKKTTSKIWRFFDRVKVNGKERAKCKKCGSSYAPGGTSNMWRHTEKYCVGRDSVDREVEFDQDIFREKLTKAMVMHNQPFKFVEYKGFRDAFTYANPKIKHISRNTAKADILKIYHVEKEKLKKVLESINGRICLTSDLWTSCASNGYMTVTAHYVDNDWVLRCKVLIFRNIPPRHDGPTVGENLISFLQEWGIERKVFTLTLDNAKYNDGVVDLLKNHLLMTNSLFFNGEFLHIRCGAHVLNLIVQMGLGTIAEAVEKIRESVKYVRGSEMRTFKFGECVKHLKLSVHKKLKQDLPYRWNSTYLMLDSALLYRRAFMHLSLFDSNYKTCPSMEEWIRVEKIAMFLAPFFDMTELFSGTQYPTASLYFPSVLEIQLLIQAEMESTDLVIQAMAKEMKPKFDKYWQEYSTVLLFAVVLDPRYKLRFVKFAFNKIDARTTVSKLRELKNHMQEFLEEYLEETPSSSSHASHSNEGHRRTGGRIVNVRQNFFFNYLYLFF